MSHKAMSESERGEINRKGKEGQRSAIEAGEGLRSTIEASGIIGGSFIEKVLHTANGEEPKIDGGKKKKISLPRLRLTLSPAIPEDNGEILMVRRDKFVKFPSA